jgi:hypothetical protein
MKLKLNLGPPVFDLRSVTVRVPGARRPWPRGQAKKKTPVPVFVGEPSPMDLHNGFIVVYESGRRLGIICGLSELETWVIARPGRTFTLLFVQRKPFACEPTSEILRPIGCVDAEAADGKVLYHQWEPA